MLEVGLVLGWSQFPGFREAFNPADIKWDLGADPYSERVSEVEQGVLVNANKLSMPTCIAGIVHRGQTRAEILLGGHSSLVLVSR